MFHQRLARNSEAELGVVEKPRRRNVATRRGHLPSGVDFVLKGRIFGGLKLEGCHAKHADGKAVCQVFPLLGELLE